MCTIVIRCRCLCDACTMDPRPSRDPVEATDNGTRRTDNDDDSSYDDAPPPPPPTSRWRDDDEEGDAPSPFPSSPPTSRQQRALSPSLVLTTSR